MHRSSTPLPLSVLSDVLPLDDDDQTGIYSAFPCTPTQSDVYSLFDSWLLLRGHAMAVTPTYCNHSNPETLETLPLGGVKPLQSRALVRHLLGESGGERGHALESFMGLLRKLGDCSVETGALFPSPALSDLPGHQGRSDGLFSVPKGCVLYMLSDAKQCSHHLSHKISVASYASLMPELRPGGWMCGTDLYLVVDDP
eukprot:g16625.t1